MQGEHKSSIWAILKRNIQIPTSYTYRYHEIYDSDARCITRELEFMITE